MELLAVSGEPLARFDPLQGGAKHIRGLAPVICMHTTSGTGSEVSVGVVIVLNDGRKLTVTHPQVIPKVAICGPELTLGLPPLLTAATGMDSIKHCIGAFLTLAINPPAEGVTLDGPCRGWRHLERAVAHGDDRDARWQMMMASTEGAMAFIKGLGAVHSMSHTISGREDLRAHHGTLNALILLGVPRFSAAACEVRYVRLCQAMGLDAGADLAAAVAASKPAGSLPKGLTALGVTRALFPDLVPHPLADPTSFAMPIEPTAEQYASSEDRRLECTQGRNAPGKTPAGTKETWDGPVFP